MTSDFKLDMAAPETGRSPQPDSNHFSPSGAVDSDERIVFISVDHGAYKPYNGFMEAYADLWKHPCDFDTDYSVFHGFEARVADAMRLRADFNRAWAIVICSALTEDNAE